MPEFPSFYTTGSTVVLPTQPLRYQPLNLTGLIQSIRERPAASTSKKTKLKEEDFEIEGRIGAVNQYMRPIRRELGRMKNLESLYGSAAYDMPEYGEIMTNLDMYSSDQRDNIVEQETEMYKNYKKNTEGKGAYYDFFNWNKTGTLNTVAEWNERNQYAETTALGDPQTEQRFIQGFDENPTLYSIEDARIAVDALFNDIGHWENGSGASVIEEKFLKNMEGALITHNTQMKKTNYGRGNDLDAAREQTMARAFTNNFDFTDPIVSGYFQAFMQRTNGLKSGIGGGEGYINEDGTIKETMAQDFQNFVQADIENHYSKRQIDVFNQDQTMQWREKSEYAYKRGDEQKRIEALQEAMLQQEATGDMSVNLGLPLNQIFPEKNFSPELLDILMQADNSPFVVSTDEQGNPYINTDYSNWSMGGEAKMHERLTEYYLSQGFPKDIAIGKAIEVAEYTRAQAEFVKEQAERGQGKLGITTTRFDEYVLPAHAISGNFEEIYSAVNSDFLVGRSAQEIGMGGYVKVGDTYIRATDLGDARYEGGYGAMKLTQNVISTNMGIEMPNGGKILFSSDTWQKMSEKQKMEMGKQGKIKLFNHDGSTGNAASRQGELFLPDETTQSMIYQAHINGNLNAPYYSPAAHTMAVDYSFKNEAEAAKALQNLEISIEVPNVYSKGNVAFKKAYDEISYDDDPIGWTGIYLSQGKTDKVPRGVDITRRYGIKTNTEAGREFVKWWDKSKENGTLAGLTRIQMTEAIAQAKAGGFSKGWRPSQYTKKVRVKASNGRTIHPVYKKQSRGRMGIVGKGDNRENRYLITVEQDITGATIGVGGTADESRVDDLFQKNNERYVYEYLRKKNQSIGSKSSTSTNAPNQWSTRMNPNNR